MDKWLLMAPLLVPFSGYPAGRCADHNDVHMHVLTARLPDVCVRERRQVDC